MLGFIGLALVVLAGCSAAPSGVPPVDTAGSGGGGGGGGSGTPPASPPPASPAAAAECAQPRDGWIFCDDFEQDRLSRYWEHGNPTAFTRTAGVGRDGSVGMRARWSQAGQVDAGHLSVAFGRTPQAYFRPADAGTATYREIWWRHYVRNEPGWRGGAGWKMDRIVSLASPSNWGFAMTGFVSGIGNGATTLTMTPQSGTDEAGTLRATRLFDAPNTRELGARAGTTPLFSGSYLGAWHCIEGHARLNDPGAANGIFEFWVDSHLEAQRTDLNWVGRFSAYGINTFQLENYWNDPGAPQPQERYFDNLVIATQRVGC